METPMRALVLLLLLTLISLPAVSAEILDAFYDVDKDKLVLDITYSGGCEKHEFTLIKVPGCMKSYPVRQKAILKHTSNGDACKALVREQIEVNVPNDLCGSVVYLDINMVNKHNNLINGGPKNIFIDRLLK